MKRVALLVCVFALGLPASLAGQSSESEVLEVVQRLFDGMRAADTAVVRSTLHPLARLVSTGTRDGIPDLRLVPMDRFVEAIGGSDALWDEKISDTEIRIDDNLAAVWTKYEFYTDGTFSHCGVDSFQLIRTSTGWLIVSIIDTRRNTGCDGGPESNGS